MHNGQAYGLDVNKLPMQFKAVIAQGWIDCLEGKNWKFYDQLTDPNLQLAYEQGRYWAANVQQSGLLQMMHVPVWTWETIVGCIQHSFHMVGNPLPFIFDQKTGERLE